MHIDEAATPDLWAAWLELSEELLALTGQDGRITWANPAFIGATGAVGGDAMGAWLVGADDAQPQLHRSGRAPLPVRVGRRAVASGVLWILRDLSEQRALEAREHALAERLDVAQEFGRLGVWERQIPSGEGLWDRHVFGFWGLDPAQGTPDFFRAMESVHPDDRRTQPYLESTARPGRHSQRYRVLRADGSTRRIHSQWEVKAGADGRPERAVGVMLDDSEAYELARSLDATTMLLGMTVDLCDIVHWRHDLKTQMVHANPNGFKLLGLEPSEDGLPVDTVRALIHPDDLPRVHAMVQRALQTGLPQDIEARYLHRDGSFRSMQSRRMVQRAADGSVIGFVGVSLDVTEQRSAEEALRGADERAALAARAAGIGTWQVDYNAAGQVETERWDDQMFALRMLEPHERPLTREERLALVHPEDRGLTIDSSIDPSPEGVPMSYEFRIVLPDGKVRWLASRSIVVRNELRQTMRRVGINWDVTDARHAEAARREKALAEQQIRAKSQLLSRVSHELRTPLNAVIGFAGLLQREAEEAGAGDQLTKLGHIRTAGEHLLALINDLLDLSGVESGQLPFESQEVELCGLVAEACLLVDGLARRHQVTLHCGKLNAALIGDPLRLRQVLTNLLSNAIKYNRAGGQVWIEAEVGDARVLLRVRDSGRGLSPQQMARLFEPFNRPGAGLREAGDGVGLGLVIVKALVEAMGGRVGVRSNLGSGTAFELDLPGKAAPPLAVDTAAAASPQADVMAPPGSGQLLYIEDNPVNVMLVEELVVRHTALRIESAVTGAKGVARARALQPDLVLVDMQLPDFDGFEVLRRLRADPETSHLRCVALSANAMADDIERARAAGFVDYWTKPIDFAAFLGALQRQLKPA